MTDVSPGHEPIAREARPIALPHACDDQRYPRLVGGYVVHCGPEGIPDRALDLRTGETVPWELEAAGPWSRSAGEVVWTTDGVVHVARDGRRGELLYPSRPAPWYLPATGAGGWVLWTEVIDGDARIAAVLPGEADPIVLADGPGLQHHPVASASSLAWVDAGDVIVAAPARGERRRYDADAGFESAPTLYGDHACWGTRDLRVVCSDGFEAPGRRPSGGGPLLLVQTEHGAVLYAAERWDEQGELAWTDAGVAVAIERRSDGTVWAVPDDPIPPGLR